MLAPKWSRMSKATVTHDLRSVHPVPKQGMISTISLIRTYHHIKIKFILAKTRAMTTFTVQGQDPPILKVRRCQQHRVHCVSMSLSKQWKPIRNILIGFDCYNATMLQSSCLHAKDSEKNVNLLKNLKISVFSVACVNAESFRDKLTLKFISSVRYPRQAWVLQHSFAPNIDTSPISDQPRPQQNSCNCTALKGAGQPSNMANYTVLLFLPEDSGMALI